MKHTYVLGLASLFTAFMSSLSHSSQQDIINLEVEVQISEYAPNGKSWDGARVYLLPFETTTVSPPEPAICVYTDSGEVVCSPTAGSHTALCPDSYRCSFNIGLTRPFNVMTVSVFDIDATGHEATERVSQFLSKGLKALEELADVDFSSSKIEREVLEANDRRWTWVESASFHLNLSEGERPQRHNKLEDLARMHAIRLVPPQISDFSNGRIRAPFEMRPIGDCVFPMPSCRFAYTEITIRSETLEEELQPWK